MDWDCRHAGPRLVCAAMVVAVVGGFVLGCAGSEEGETYPVRASGTPVGLGSPLNSDSSEYNPELSWDGLTLVFSSRREGGHGSNDLWMAQRERLDTSWNQPQNLGPAINTEQWETGPSMTRDMLELYFTSKKSGDSGRDIYVARRDSIGAPFGEVKKIADSTVNTEYTDSGPYISYDGLVLVFSSDRPGGEGERDLYIATRTSRDEPFRGAQSLGATVNSHADDSSPTMTADKRTLFFHSKRKHGFFSPLFYDRPNHDIYVTQRSSIDAPWSEPFPLENANTPNFHDGTPSVSSDGTTLHFRSGRPGTVGYQDIWKVSLEGLPDSVEAMSGRQ